MARYGFVVSYDVYTTTTLGGICGLACEPAGGNIYKLTARQGSGDYLFPYINSDQGGVGVCVVPAGRANGTLVVTGGMNGCALEVNKSGSDFYFYHDNNSTSLKGKLTPGEVVCRVNYKDYVGPLDIGQKLVDQYLTERVGAGYEYYCITVRSGGRWKVYVSALIRVTTVSTPTIFRPNVKTSVEYKSFKPGLTPLMASFDDA